VAVDYLLQPFQPAIHSGPVLSRLVNMHFARGDLGRYYLHQVDRDYAVNRVPQGQREDRDAGSATFTRYALRARAADYFRQIRTPRETWRSLDDLAPQLAEFELRCANADYDTAAALLIDIDVDYLQKWGHYRLAVNMHERLLGRLADPHLQMATAGALGSSYMVLGQTERAVEHYQQALAIAREAGLRRNEGALLDKLGGIYRLIGQTERAIEHSRQALAIARETGDRNAEGLGLGSLGNNYLVLGQMGRAIRYYQQALAIARETGNLGYQGGWTGSLGSTYLFLGQIGQAIQHYQEALAITRETGNRASEAFWLGNLGECYLDLGQTEKAAEHYQEALAITRETGNRAGEAFWLAGLGNVYRDLEQTEQAFDYYQQAVEIGDDTGHAQVQAEARLGLAQVHLLRGEWSEARKVTESAPSQGYRPLLPQVFVALGTAHLRGGHSANAEKAFSAALSAANDLLASTDGLIAMLYAKGIASAGQAVTGKPDMAQVACRTFEQALAVAPAAGFRARVLRQLDLLAPADSVGVLTEIRRVLSEELRDAT
jgi:tetratricopeptide (TPR) repeat protein